MAKRFIGNVKGVGVSDFSWEYYLSSSSAVLDGGSWSATPPTLGNNKYLWMRSKVTLTDGTIQYTVPVCEGVWEEIYGIYAIGDKVDGALSDVTDLKSRMTAEENKVQPINKGGTGAITAEVARKNLGLSKYADLNPETLIPSGADLNDYREVGSYKSVNAANSKTLSNTPYIDGGFNLQVISTSSNDVKQILIANSAKIALVYTRSITASGTFNDWIQMGTTVIEKAWENASPTSSFPTQALTLDLSTLTPRKDLVAVEAAINNTDNSGVDTFIGVFVNGKRGIRMGFVYGANSKNMSYYRSVEFTSDKKLTFNNAYASSPTQDAIDNTKCIPLSIYTVKGVL